MLLLMRFGLVVGEVWERDKAKNLTQPCVCLACEDKQTRRSSWSSPSLLPYFREFYAS